MTDQTDFGLVPPPGPRGRKVPARERLVRDRPHTQVKLAAYREYLPEWMRILGQTWRVEHLYVLDLFAGPGEYADKVAGSPVIAADAAVLVQRQLRGRVRIHLRFVEKDAKTRGALEASLNRYRGEVDYHVLDGSADERAPGLLVESRGHPTLALLDPDGIEVPMDLVRQFGHRTRTEVLLSFDVQGLLRAPRAAQARFLGEEVTWDACVGPDGALDADLALEQYRLQLARDRLFRYSSVQRISFPKVHANRAIAQGCGSTKGTEKWLQAFSAAATAHQAEMDGVGDTVRQKARIGGAIGDLRAWAGRSGVLYGPLVQHINGRNLTEEEVRQVLLFLRERGLVSWSSRLGRQVRPAPRFTFADPWPATVAWDGQERTEVTTARTLVSTTT